MAVRQADHQAAAGSEAEIDQGSITVVVAAE
jgi:hypothetical protein